MPASPLTRCLGIALVLAAGAAPWPGRAQGGKPAPVPADAAAACERAARQSVAPQADAAVDVSFTAAPTADPTMSSEAQVVLRGAGRWRAGTATRSFSYSCTVDLQKSEAVGLVLRDTTPAGALPAPERALPEPDLSHVSPAACESGAAAALTRRWPGVSQISFDPATRSLRQPSPTRAELQGQGRATPAPGMPSTHFRFDCEIDPRDGRVLSTHVSG